MIYIYYIESEGVLLFLINMDLFLLHPVHANDSGAVQER